MSRDLVSASMAVLAALGMFAVSMTVNASSGTERVWVDPDPWQVIVDTEPTPALLPGEGHYMSSKLVGACAPTATIDCPAADGTDATIEAVVDGGTWQDSTGEPYIVCHKVSKWTEHGWGYNVFMGLNIYPGEWPTTWPDVAACKYAYTDGYVYVAEVDLTDE